LAFQKKPFGRHGRRKFTPNWVLDLRKVGHAALYIHFWPRSRGTDHTLYELKARARLAKWLNFFSKNDLLGYPLSSRVFTTATGPHNGMRAGEGGVVSMRNASKNLSRERRRSKRRGKFWARLGRITLKLLVLAPLLTKMVEMVLVIIRWLRE
jgi:hypothetical protein